jgi:hypothetical protein
MHIPKDICRIIRIYVHAFNEVEYQIGECLNHYFEIEDQSKRILGRFCDRLDCTLHRKDLRVRINAISKEAARMIENILEEQTVLPVQISLLIFLKSELVVDSFNLFLMGPLPSLAEAFYNESHEHYNPDY